MAKIVNPYIQFYTSVDHTFIQEQCAWYYPINGMTYWNNPEPGHIWKWAAKKPNDQGRYPLDFQQFSDNKRPYGKNWRIVPSYGPDNKSPLDAYSLRYFHPFSWDYHVIPIVQVAADFHYDNEGVRVACENFLHNVAAVSDWYASQLGNGFRVLRPMAIPSNRRSDQWKAIYDAQSDRYDLWKACLDDVKGFFDNRMNSNLIYLVTQYNGNKPDWDYDAAGGGNFSVVSSFATNWKYQPGTPSPLDETVMYAIAHELGHCFGLGHTEQNMAPGEDWGKSVMMWGKPNDAILVKYEKERLKNNSFFNWT